MIFDRQEYQQECISNIIALLEDFDFTKQDNLHTCLKRFHQSHPMPVRTINEDKKNIDILMETGTGKTFTYLNLIFELNKVYKQNKFIIFVPRKAILESVKQNIELTKEYFYQSYGKYLIPYYYSSQTKSKTKSTKISSILTYYVGNPDELSVLVLTDSSISKGDNILNRRNEQVRSIFNNFTTPKTTLEAIAQLNPISIIDEPHLLQGTQFNKYFQTIKSLYFRFGATFPKDKKAPEYHLSNMAYCLDSINAFRNYLVKQVRVNTLSGGKGDYALKWVKTINNKKVVCFHHPNYKDLKFGIGEDLSAIGLAGITINNIKDEKLHLSNETTIEKAPFKLGKDEISQLLKQAIDLHFQKEEFLFKHRIKALSLFFIQNVADFRPREGQQAYVEEEFARLYKLKRAEILSGELDPDYRAYLERDFKADGTLRVHEGYFSEDTPSRDPDDAMNIILKEKQKLLSFDTSLRFIFSVWALQEGWDNPNVFTITKLAPSTSENSAHQQVGRGLRLCVNQEGKRITHNHLDQNSEQFYDINRLDIVLNAKEGNFIKKLQKDIDSISFTLDNDYLTLQALRGYGLRENTAFRLLVMLENEKIITYNEEEEHYRINSPLADFLAASQEARELLGEQLGIVEKAFQPHANKAPRIIDGNKQPKNIKIKPSLAKQFKELWDTINQRAHITYQNINEAELIQNIAHKFNANPIEKETIELTQETFDPHTKNTSASILSLGTYDLSTQLTKDLEEHFTKLVSNTSLPLSFLVRCYNATDKTSFRNSPIKAFDKLADIIKQEIHANMVARVDYKFSTNTFMPSTPSSQEDPLYHPDGSPRDSIPHSMLGRQIDDENPPAQHYLYESIVYDSEIERLVSQEDAQEVGEANSPHSIKVFAKLPKFTIPTPYKDYQPDFAYLIESKHGDKIFFVCETKGYDDEQDIPEDERKKIDYAKKFFQALESNLKDKNIRVEFATRINKENLRAHLAKILNKNKEK